MKTNLVMVHVTYFRGKCDHCAFTTTSPAGNTRRLLSYTEMLNMLNRVMSIPTAEYWERQVGDSTFITASAVHVKI